MARISHPPHAQKQPDPCNLFPVRRNPITPSFTNQRILAGMRISLRFAVQSIPLFINCNLLVSVFADVFASPICCEYSFSTAIHCLSFPALVLFEQLFASALESPSFGLRLASAPSALSV